jgi:hypothetical protein
MSDDGEGRAGAIEVVRDDGAARGEVRSLLRVGE